MKRNNSEPKTRSGFMGTWNPEGNTMYLDGKKFMFSKTLQLVCLPQDDRDREYLKSVKSQEMGSQFASSISVEEETERHLTGTANPALWTQGELLLGTVKEE